MKGNKIICSVLAFVLASGAFTVLPAATGMETAAVVSAQTDDNGFILEEDEDGDLRVTGYKGKGGKITIPEEALYIHNDAFKNNKKITSVVCPKGTTAYGIGYSAFSGCTNLRSVVIEGDCAFIGENAFSECVQLKTVSFGGNVEYDGDGGILANAFSQCQALRTVEFKKEDAIIDVIGARAFYNCYLLNSVNLPSGLKTIGENTFVNCVKLKEVAIPEKTVIKGKHSFGYMSGYETAEAAVAAISGDETASAKFVKANGSRYVYRERYTVNEKGKLSAKPCKLTQGEITLKVEKGSKAEAWAEKYGIKYISVNSHILDEPEDFEIETTENSIKFSWGKVEGAAGYRVYRYDEKTKKFVKYKNVSKNSCTVTGLKSGTKYRFRVAALEKDGDRYVMGKISKNVTAETASEAKQEEEKTGLPELEPLSKSAQNKLRKDFVKYQKGNASDKYIHAYYGTYKEGEVVVMWDRTRPVTFDLKQVTVGNYTITVGSGSFTLCLHRGSAFIEISKAYEAGYLTDDDIAAIYGYSNTEHIYKYANI